MQCGPSTSDHLLTSCVHLCRSAHPAPLTLCYILAFPLCVLPFSSDKTLSLSPRYHEMKFKPLLPFTFRRKLSFLASSVLLGQGAPPGARGSPGPVSSGLFQGVTESQNHRTWGLWLDVAPPELLLALPWVRGVTQSQLWQLLPAGGSSGSP